MALEPPWRLWDVYHVYVSHSLWLQSQASNVLQTNMLSSTWHHAPGLMPSVGNMEALSIGPVPPTSLTLAFPSPTQSPFLIFWLAWPMAHAVPRLSLIHI